VQEQGSRNGRKVDSVPDHLSRFLFFTYTYTSKPRFTLVLTPNPPTRRLFHERYHGCPILVTTTRTYQQATPESLDGGFDPVMKTASSSSSSVPDDTERTLRKTWKWLENSDWV
jgi:hypothetical protein